jgi:hypothetical protein
MSDFSPFPESFDASNKPQEPQASPAESFPNQDQMPTPPGPGAEEPVAPPSLDQATVFTSGEVIPPMPEPSVPPAPPVGMPPAKKSKKTLWIVLAVVLILVCVCCIVAVVAGLSSPDVQDFFNEFDFSLINLLAVA